MHKADIVAIRKRNHNKDFVPKPIFIYPYNQKMGRVYKNHVIIGSYSCIRKTYKWEIQKVYATSLKMHYMMPSLLTVRRTKKSYEIYDV